MVYVCKQDNLRICPKHLFKVNEVEEKLTVNQPYLLFISIKGNLLHSKPNAINMRK